MGINSGERRENQDTQRLAWSIPDLNVKGDARASPVERLDPVKNILSLVLLSQCHTEHIKLRA